MEKEGYDLEIIDLIFFKFFDMEIISVLVKKIYWVIIVEECMKIGGIGVEFIVLINDYFFDELDGLVVCFFF